MTWKDGFYEAIKQYITILGVNDVETIVSLEDRTDSGGYCETCYYEYIVCDITYVTHNGQTKTYTHWEPFADLIRNLTD